MVRSTHIQAALCLLLIVTKSSASSIFTNPAVPDSVARSAFARQIVDREPVEDLDTVYTDIKKIFYFSDLRDMAGQSVTHRWLYRDESKAEIAFRVRGPRWRVHSSKNLLPEWTGKWKVQVVDSSGSVIHEDSFVYLANPKLRPTPTRQPPVPESPAQGTSSDSLSSPFVKRAVLTSEVVDREPVDNLNSITTDLDKVYFFTEIIDLEDQRVKHRWIHGGEIKAEIEFEIGGPRWRVYSSKHLMPAWSGTWKVQVLDDQGNVLHAETFDYQSGR